MANQLLVSVSSVNVPAGGSVVVTHGLLSAGKAVAPTLILPDRVTPLVVSAVNAATYTVSNPTAGALVATFRSERGHSPELDPLVTPLMAWQGGAAGGGVTSVSVTPPLTTSGPAASPTIGLGWTTDFALSGTDVGLSATGVGAGAYGNAAALPESSMPRITVDAKGRVTAASASSITLGGTPAKAYVDTADAATLAAANAFAQSLAFAISSKDAAHTATTAPLSAYGVDGTKKILTASVNGAIGLIGGHAVLAGDRILVKDEAGVLAPNNGLYVVTALGDGLNPWVLTRTADADAAGELCGALVPVEDGTLAGSVWIFSANSSTFVLGTTNVIWTQLSVPAATTTTLGIVQLSGGLGGAGTSASLPKLDMDHASSGTLAIARGGTGAASTSQGFAFIGPAVGAGAPSFRALLASDIPALAPTKLTPGSNGQFLVTAGGVAAWANPSAGGILGYTGSTYPNPTGLVAINVSGSSVIPLLPLAGVTFMTIRPDDSAGATQGTALTIRSGAATGSSSAGTLTLEGGASASATGGSTLVRGGTGVAGGDAALLAGANNTIGPSGSYIYVYGSTTTASGGITATTQNFAGGSSGTILIRSGAAATTGYLQIFSGNATGSSGSVQLFSGTADTGSSGYLIVRVGATVSGTPGLLSIIGGNVQNTGITPGAINITAGYNTTDFVYGAITYTASAHTFIGTVAIGGNTYPTSALATGGLIYASSPGVLAARAIGSTGNTLTVVGGVPSWAALNLAGGAGYVSGTLPVGNGGTGVAAAPANGQLLIGNGAGYTQANLTAGSGVSITNGAGSITIAATAPSGGSAATGAYKGITSADSPYTVLSTDYCINLTSGSATVTLPAAATAGAGRMYIVKNSDGGTATVVRSGADTIDGATSISIPTQYASYTFMSTGSGWIII